MKQTEITQIIQQTNGTRKHRTITNADGDYFLKLFEQFQDNPRVHTIRVYSSGGFVPHSYKWRAEVCALEATRDQDGVWHITGRIVDAHRKNGVAALATINSRPASEYLK